MKYKILIIFFFTLSCVQNFDKLENKSSLKASAKTVLIGLFVLGVIFTLVGWALNHPEFILKNFKMDLYVYKLIHKDLFKKN